MRSPEIADGRNSPCSLPPHGCEAVVVQGIAELDVDSLLRQDPPHVVLAPDRAGTVLGHGVEEQPHEFKRRRRKLVPRPGQTAKSCRFKKLRALAKGEIKDFRREFSFMFRVSAREAGRLGYSASHEARGTTHKRENALNFSNLPH